MIKVHNVCKSHAKSLKNVSRLIKLRLHCQNDIEMIVLIHLSIQITWRQRQPIKSLIRVPSLPRAKRSFTRGTCSTTRPARPTSRTRARAGAPTRASTAAAASIGMAGFTLANDQNRRLHQREKNGIGRNFDCYEWLIRHSSSWFAFGIACCSYFLMLFN